MKSKYLNSEQIEYIRKIYGYKRTSTIAEELSVSSRYVQKVAEKLGVVDLKNKYYIKDDTAYILCVDTNDNQIYFQIDLEDLEKVLYYSKWFLKKNKNKLYVVCNKEINNKRTIVRLHRFLLDFPEQDIDHIDGNSLNNKKNNLRLCDDSQNMSNLIKCRVDNSIGLLNITKDGKTGKYRPEIYINKKRIYFKRFELKEDAIKLIKYVRANYLPYSQEALNKDEINEETPNYIKSYADEKVKKRLQES